MRRARGFTLIELVTYLGLLTAGLTTIAGIQLAASRAAFLEWALIDLHAEQDLALARFAEDVTLATKADLEDEPERPLEPGRRSALVVRRADGKTVRWGTAADAKGAQRFTRALQGTPDESYPHIEGWRFTIDRAEGRAPFVKVELSLAYRKGNEQVVKRRFERVVQPRAWELAR
jgi:hypothetical protein